MAITEYTYNKSPCSVARLQKEIQDSLIIIALDHISMLGSVVSIFFKDTISNGDEDILDALIANHSGLPLIEEQVIDVNVSNSLSIQSAPSFGAKTAVINGVLKKFFARNTGAQYDLVSGSNEITFTIGYPWVKITGIECMGAETLDTCELRVYDSPAGTYSGVSGALLNQFGYALNIGKDFYQRSAPYDADLYYGMVLKLNYVSKSVKRIGVNFLMTEVKS